jgi:glutamate--cysteine ligase
MNTVFLERLKGLDTPRWHSYLQDIQRGFEKESLRVTPEHIIANTPHPVELGSSLTHPMITTDYSEALLEFITPPTNDLDRPFQDLSELHQYVYAVLPDNEILWGGSMPCHLPKNEADIPIAQYGSSYLGQLKHIYRKGLGYRYGRAMQMIAGVHYNFSLPISFWEAYHHLLESPEPLQEFISEQYLHIIRNTLRFSWLFPLLFGASPAIDKFINFQATSLRLSDRGYQNRSQKNFPISYNNFSEFIQSIEHAVYTSIPAYEKIGIKIGEEYRQLSSGFFQTEDEHYGLIRPKRVSLPEERMLTALKKGGIEYLEVRALDLDPFSPIGIQGDTIGIIDAFLLMCLLEDSPILTLMDETRISQNLAAVVTKGLNPHLTLLDKNGQSRNMRDWGLEIIGYLEKTAGLLDKVYHGSRFSIACRTAKKSLEDFSQLPSSRLLSLLKENQTSYISLLWECSLKHAQFFKEHPLSSAKRQYYDRLVKESLTVAETIENQPKNAVSFDAYLAEYLKKRD